MALVATLWASSFHASAQIGSDTYTDLYKDYQYLPTPSPEVWGFMKYGNQSAELYTGKATVSIPIYTYQDTDFTLPLSIDYTSDGYKPNTQTGILGLGWTLNAGGCITREMRGIPDEAQNRILSTPLQDGMSAPYAYNGYFSYHNLTATPESWDDAIARNHIPLGGLPKMIPVMDANNRESEQDIFHFNFPGHSGSFILGPQGTVHVYNTAHPQGEYKVILTNFPNGIIKIQTGDGYTYTFGGTDQNKIDTYTQYEELRYGVSGQPMITPRLSDYPFNDRMTWMLTKIEAPNGRAIEFEYSPATSTSSKQYDSYRPTALWQVVNNQLEEIIPVSPALQPDTAIIFMRQRGVTLNQIVVDDALAISFTYGNKMPEKGWSLYHNLQTTQVSFAKYNLVNELGILNHITIRKTTENTPLKVYTFGYDTNPGYDATNPYIEGNPITFLDSIALPDGSYYRFDYYDQNKAFPYHGTAAIDHWGYYNAVSNTGAMIGPSHLLPPTTNREDVEDYIYIDSNYREHITGLFPNREPNGAAARMGMLRTLTYPTGGSTRYDYEQHSYSQKVSRYAAFSPSCTNADEGGGYTYDTPTNYPAGGVRVKKIVDFSATNDSTYREFVYQSAPHTGSGILLHYPRYLGELMTFVGSNGGLEDAHYSIRKFSSSNTLAYSEDKTHISYPLVKEVFSDGSLIEHRYKSFTDTPDQPSYAAPTERLWGNASAADLVVLPPVAHILYRMHTSQHNLRGKPSSKKYYDSNAALLSETTYTYTNDYQYAQRVEFIRSTFFFYSYIDLRKDIVSNYYLTGEQTTDYRNGSSVVLGKRYRYNPVGRLSEVATLNSVGDSLKTTFEYISDLQGYGTDETNLYQAHRLALPVFEEEYVKSSGTGTWTLTHAVYNEYNHPGSYLTSRITQSRGRNTTTGQLSNYVTDYTYEYDALGRVIAITDGAGIKTAYVWGYDGLYPIIEIRNIGNEALPLLNEEYWEMYDWHSVLRDDYPQAQVTTYTYKPFIGKSTETTPDGTTIGYEYDEAGRLKWTYIVVAGERQYVGGNKYRYNNQ
jgi:hypothetical protein